MRLRGPSPSPPTPDPSPSSPFTRAAHPDPSPPPTTEQIRALPHPSAASSLLVAPAPLLPLPTPGRSPLVARPTRGCGPPGAPSLSQAWPSQRAAPPRRGSLGASPQRTAPPGHGPPGRVPHGAPPLPSTALTACGPSRAWWIWSPFSARRPDLQLQAQPHQGSCSSECSLLPVAEVSPLPTTSTHNTSQVCMFLLFPFVQI